MLRTLASMALLLIATLSCAPGAVEPPRAAAPLPPTPGLDAWVAAREARVPGLRPWAASTIVWADPARKAKTPVALVYLAGYTASHDEIAPVPQRVAAALGANLYLPRMTGTGVGPDGHRTVTAGDWMGDAVEALAVGRQLGDRVVLIGTSTGGTLLTWLMLTGRADDVAASVLVSPNLTPKDPNADLLIWPGNELFLAVVMPEVMELPSHNPAHERLWDLAHHRHSLIPMMQLVDLARRQDFTRWPSPALVVYDPDDGVVDEAVTVRKFSQVPGDRVELHLWKEAPGEDRHVLAGDALSPGGTGPMTELMTGYLKRVLGL